MMGIVSRSPYDKPVYSLSVDDNAISVCNCDTTSMLLEIKHIENKTSAHITMLFENKWLSHYPRPLRVVHDPGGEFVGPEFQAMLIMNGIQAVPTTAKNPQANTVCKHVHQTIGDMLKTVLLNNPPVNIRQAVELIKSILASVQYAVRASIHRTLGISPGALVFHCDMILPIPILANYNLIHEQHQTAIDENNRKENLHHQFQGLPCW